MEYNDVAVLFNNLAKMIEVSPKPNLCLCPRCDPKTIPAGRLLSDWLKDNNFSPAILREAASKLANLGAQLKPLVPVMKTRPGKVQARS